MTLFSDVARQVPGPGQQCVAGQADHLALVHAWPLLPQHDVPRLEAPRDNTEILSPSQWML